MSNKEHTMFELLVLEFLPIIANRRDAIKMLLLSWHLDPHPEEDRPVKVRK
jgi:hypothetical protein